MPEESESHEFDVDAISVPTQSAGPVAIFRFEFANEQTLREFGAFLQCIDKVYYALHSFQHFAAHLPMTPAEVGLDHPMPLALRSLHISSPGWLEVLGGLNPLKWIFDYTKLWLDYVSSAPS